MIKQRLQEKKAEQDEIERENIEINRKAEEARLLREEQERIAKEEADKIEKERVAHIKDLRKRGLLLSKKEQEKKDARDNARRRLIEQGLIDPEEFEKSKGDPNKKVVYSTKKNKKNKNKPAEVNKESQIDEDNKDEEVHEETEAPKLDKNDEEEKKEVEHSVKPGMEETADEIRKPAANDTTKEIDDELKLDDWEDMLDDSVAEKLVKIQEENAPAVDAKIEQLLETTSTTMVSESAKTDVTISKDSKESKKDAKAPKKDAAPATGAGSIFERGRKIGADKNKKKVKGKGNKKEEDKEDGEERFRCPIICVLGHVDTGKTLLLDKIRKTNVQRGEAGGITQQIGATYFPGEALQKSIDKLGDDFDVKEVKIPGLLVIDTPGHESFTNLRSRGSNLCDLAVLVVDVMHGLEKQTLESIELLRKRKTPFIVALNKIDVTHGWEAEEYRSSKIALESQIHQVTDEYEVRKNKAFLQFNELGMNIIEYWKNDDPRTYISAIPTSAMTGEGIPDILGMIVKTTQKMLRKKVLERNDEFACTVLEVKRIAGIGTTIDVVLVNGKLSEKDTIVVAGFNGPIVTSIRALLTPYPMKEMRVKGDYLHHKELYGAMGIKISAPGLELALAGGELYKAENEEQVQALCEEIEETMFNFAEKYVNPSEEGVCVQASTLGSLEALLEFLKTSKIPVCSVNIGVVYKKDIMKALKAIQGEKNHKEYATILAFDVKVEPEAREYAEENGITIFEADIIYHLFDQFTEYVEKCRNDRKKDEGAVAVFP